MAHEQLALPSRQNTTPLPRPSLHGRGAVTLDSLSVRFAGGGREAVALANVDLAIAPGEFVAILGPSGCGKSTLLNVIAGFERPSAGRVLVDGGPVSTPGPDRPVVFQQHSLFPWMSALDNVAFGLRMAGQASTRARERARHYLGLVGLGDFHHRYPHELSGGMQQRVGLARALAVEPTILLMDEPFGALDAQTRVLMQEQLLRLWERWRHTVVFVTHDIDEAVFLADRIVVLGLLPNIVRGAFDVALSRPRSRGARASAAYQSLYNALFDLIRQESQKTFGTTDTVTAP